MLRIWNDVWLRKRTVIHLSHNFENWNRLFSKWTDLYIIVYILGIWRYENLNLKSSKNASRVN